MECTAMIWRSWVRTPVGLILECVELSKSNLNAKCEICNELQTCLSDHTNIQVYWQSCFVRISPHSSELLVVTIFSRSCGIFYFLLKLVKDRMVLKEFCLFHKI